MPARIESGTTLGGRFRLQELVGSGGMGSVYAALDLERGHRVAVKVLSRRLAQRTEFRERFLAESRLAASLPHPHILTVHAHGEDDGWHFLAMPLVRTDLAAMLETGPLAATRALNLVEQVAWALDVAGEAGLVHRDVKPANVLVEPRRGPEDPDTAYLGDFGIAKLESAEARLTSTGAFLGTIDYASPEQSRAADLGPRSDQYALACVLFEALAGGAPFPRSDAQSAAAAHREAARPTLSGRAPGLPVALDPVIARGMAVAPEDRWPSSRAFVAAAREALREPTTVAGGRSRDVPTSAPLPDPPGERRADVGGRAVDETPRGPAAVPWATPRTARAPAGAPRPGDPAPPPAPAAADVRPAGPRRRRGRGRATAALLALVLLAAGGALAAWSPWDGAEDGTATPGAPGRSASGGADPEGAEAAVRRTVAAYAGARGARATCRTVVREDRSTCENGAETAQPTSFAVRRVVLADDVARVDAAQQTSGARVELELRREAGTWLVADEPSVDWKDADEAGAAGTVARFGARGEDACELLAPAIASQCATLLPPSPVVYDISLVSVTRPTASVTAELASGDTDRFELLDGADGWRITSVG